MKKISLLLFFIVAFTIFLSSCTGNLSEDEIVTAATNPPTLSLTNHGSEPVYHFVVGQQVAATISWAPSLDKRIRLDPGTTKKLDYSEISLDNESKVIIYWWRGVEKNGEKVPGKVHSFTKNLF